MTHVRFGRSHLHPIGQLTHTRRSDGAPDPDGPLKEEVRTKIRHYRNIYLNRPDEERETVGRDQEQLKHLFRDEWVKKGMDDNPLTWWKKHVVKLSVLIRGRSDVSCHTRQQ